MKPKVGGLEVEFVRAHQTSVVKALGSIQGSRGSNSVHGRRRVFGRGACLTSGGVGVCGCVASKRKARQGQAQQREAKPAQICGSPRVGLVWFAGRGGAGGTVSGMRRAVGGVCSRTMAVMVVRLSMVYGSGSGTVDRRPS